MLCWSCGYCSCDRRLPLMSKGGPNYFKLLTDTCQNSAFQKERSEHTTSPQVEPDVAEMAGFTGRDRDMPALLACKTRALHNALLALLNQAWSTLAWTVPLGLWRLNNMTNGSEMFASLSWNCLPDHLVQRWLTQRVCQWEQLDQDPAKYLQNNLVLHGVGYHHVQLVEQADHVQSWPVNFPILESTSSLV